jgi:molecular chaperone DnaJ
MRLRGEGEPGTLGGQPGDLYVEIAVRHHELFSREGKHVLLDRRIGMTLAALGGELDVPTVGGENKTIYVPPGSQHGKLVRIPGLGFPVPGSSARGDQIVALSVATPKDLTERQVELLMEFARIEEEKRNEGPLKGMARKIGEKVKKVFNN